MTSLDEIRRRAAQIELDLSASRPGGDNLLQVAEYRVAHGIPGDEDIELLLEDVTVGLLFTFRDHVHKENVSRAEQLERMPAIRLLVDVLDARDEIERHRALVALRRLASDGSYESGSGPRRAEPRARGYGRVYLRAVVRYLADRAGPETSERHEIPPASPTESPP